MDTTVTTSPAVGMYAFRSPAPRRIATFWAELTDPDGNPFRVFAPRPVEEG